MAVSVGIKQYGQTHIHGIQQQPFQAIGDAMESIPHKLAQNCGIIRTITQLRAKHAENNDNNKCCCTWGINGITGEIVDLNEYGIWEPLTVKQQTIKTAIESACMILHIDDNIISGSKKQG